MRKQIKLLALFAVLATALTGCVAPGGGSNGGNGGTTAQPADTSFATSDEEMFTDRDQRDTYDENGSVLIQLNGNSASCTSSKVKIDGSTVTITDEGTYILSGTLDNGMVIVDAEETDKPQLVLNGASITSATSAALYVLESDKVFVTLAENTQNTLKNGGTFTAIDENNIDGAVFSKQELTFNGKGSLSVSTTAGHGIVCKDDLVFTEGTYTISASSHGIDANDSVRATGSTFSITAGKDGVHSENSDDTTLGFVYVSGGSFTIAAGDDGIHADETLAVTAGTIEITKSYEGLEALSIEISGGNIKLAASDDGLNAAGGTDSSGYDGDRPRQQRERRGFVHARVGVPKSGHKLARSRERAEVYVVRGQFVKLGNGVT